MGFAGKLLVLTAALTATVAPSVASAAPPSGELTVSAPGHRPAGQHREHRRPGWRAVRDRERGRQGHPGRSEDRGHHDVRERFAEDDPSRRPRRRDRRRVPRPHRLRAGDPGRPRSRRPGRGRDLPGGRPPPLHRRRGHRAFALDNPPEPAFFIPSGVQYAMEPYRGGFLVTDGHHNRVYRVTLDGTVSELIAFGDIVPTGLAVRGQTRCTWPRPARFPTCPERQGGEVRARVDHRHAGGRRRPARSSTWSSVADTGSTPSPRAIHAGRPGGLPGRPEHRRAGAGQPRRHDHAPSWPAWTGRLRSSSSGTPRTSSRSAETS